MRVIIFTWEFPPRIVGELSRYVDTLAAGLVKKRVETYVVTFHDSWTGYHEREDGVKTYRVSNPVKPHTNVLTWALTLNQEIARAASDIYYSVKRKVNLIDVHDWHFLPAAVSLKKALDIPFTYSVESLETHRSHGSSSTLSLSIMSLERQGTDESDRVMVKSDWMRQEVHRICDVPFEKIEVVSPQSPTWVNEVLGIYRKTKKGYSEKPVPILEKDSE